jgi:hypothetical protein
LGQPLSCKTEVSSGRSTASSNPMKTGRTKRSLTHIEAMHQPPLGSEATKAPCSLEPQLGQSVSAAMKKTALGNTTESLMEQIADPGNIEQAWKRVKANRGVARKVHDLVIGSNGVGPGRGSTICSSLVSRRTTRSHLDRAAEARGLCRGVRASNVRCPTPI